MMKVVMILLWGGYHGGPAMESFDSMQSCQDAAAIIRQKVDGDAVFRSITHITCIEVPK